MKRIPEMWLFLAIAALWFLASVVSGEAAENGSDWWRLWQVVTACTSGFYITRAWRVWKGGHDR